MALDDDLKLAAHHAETAVRAAMTKYKSLRVTDEDDITSYLVGQLDAVLTAARIGKLRWSATIVRHYSGRAAEESVTGADLLIHVSINASKYRYSKGVLVQAKRIEPHRFMRPADHGRLIEQCEKMLNITPASFVFDYTTSGMRVGAATRVKGRQDRDLYAACNLTPYRFFLEFFRCPIGDPKITSASVSELDVPEVLELQAVEQG